MSDFGFSYSTTKSGDVMISWEGRVVTTLRGKRAEKFLAAVEDANDAEEQHLMARYTGNFKRGNERPPRRGERDIDRE